MINFSINGFGRIGRIATRVWLKSHTDLLNLTAINTSGSLPASGWAHLLKYDTSYGILPFSIESTDLKPPKQATEADPLIGYISINKGKKIFKIPILAQRDPSLIPWDNFGVETVVESTGVFRTRETAGQHLIGGAKQVIISAPVIDGSVSTAIIGVNEEQLIEKDRTSTITVLSNASCTTNCVAPVAAVMHSHIGINKAMLNTIHGFTDDQNLQDNSHKDMRRARAASYNIVPTSTGAALATTETISELKGLFDGVALRVPVITGSITDFTFITSRTTSVAEINEIFISAALSPLYKNILAVTDEPLVSSDIVARSESAIVDLSLTRVVDGDLVKVMAWYDNEYGYANRLIEQVSRFGEN